VRRTSGGHRADAEEVKLPARVLGVSWGRARGQAPGLAGLSAAGVAVAACAGEPEVVEKLVIETVVVEKVVVNGSRSSGRRP